jgi:hypothetical protein
MDFRCFEVSYFEVVLLDVNYPSRRLPWVLGLSLLCKRTRVITSRSNRVPNWGCPSLCTNRKVPVVKKARMYGFKSLQFYFYEGKYLGVGSTDSRNVACVCQCALHFLRSCFGRKTLFRMLETRTSIRHAPTWMLCPVCKRSPTVHLLMPTMGAPSSRNPNPETQTQRPKPRDPNPETQTQRLKPRDSNPEAKVQRPKPRDPNPETIPSDPNLEVFCVTVISL